MSTGGCFCGAVRFEVQGDFTGVTYCHCSKCRRWHGHAGAYTAANRREFAITQSQGLKWHQVSEHVRRAFCSECGSLLFWDDPRDARIGICASAVDAPNTLRENAHIYVGSKGSYYEIGGALPQHDTMPKR